MMNIQFYLGDRLFDLKITSNLAQYLLITLAFKALFYEVIDFCFFDI